MLILTLSLNNKNAHKNNHHFMVLIKIKAQCKHEPEHVSRLEAIAIMTEKSSTTNNNNNVDDN